MLVVQLDNRTIEFPHNLEEEAYTLARKYHGMVKFVPRPKKRKPKEYPKFHAVCGEVQARLCPVCGLRLDEKGVNHRKCAKDDTPQVQVTQVVMTPPNDFQVEGEDDMDNNPG